MSNKLKSFISGIDRISSNLEGNKTDFEHVAREYFALEDDESLPAVIGVVDTAKILRLISEGSYE